MTSPVSFDDQFQAAMDRYTAGEDAATLIPEFEAFAQRSPKSEATWTCLSWLYLLEADAEAAFKAAQRAVKISRTDAQARVNLVLAMLELGRAGVRPQIDAVKQILNVDREQQDIVKNNLLEGQKRRSDWQFVTRVQTWLEE